MTPLTETQKISITVGVREIWPPALAAFIIAVIAQAIGQRTLQLGPASIVFFPMVWGLLLAGFLSLQRVKRVSLDFQKIANLFVGIAVSILIARLAFNIGPNLSLLISAGPALLLQELGNVFGSLLFALPLAVLLRMGRATIGATFSLDREPSFGMVREKYGSDSDQFRGVLAMYVFGTLFGALYITFLASFLVTTGWFDALALAMGAGIGSGSMMAAGTGVIVDAFPAMESEIMGVAAVANLLATIGGVYLGIYISLPLADRFYHFLTRKSRANEVAPETLDTATNRELVAQLEEAARPVTAPLWYTVPIVFLVGLTTASIVGEGLSWQIVAGYAVLTALVLLSEALAWVTRRKIAAIVWVTTIGAYISSPWFPGSEVLGKLVGSVDLLSIATAVLTFAGLSLGKDADLLKSVGWKIIPVGLVSLTAAFLLSTVIAEFTLGLWG